MIWCRSGAPAGQEQGARRCSWCMRDRGCQGSEWGLYGCCTEYRPCAPTARLPRQAQQHHLNHLALWAHCQSLDSWIPKRRIVNLSTSLPEVFTSRCPGAQVPAHPDPVRHSCCRVARGERSKTCASDSSSPAHQHADRRPCRLEACCQKNPNHDSDDVHALFS